MKDDIDNEDYRTLAAFRYELRRFLHFSEAAAGEAGLTVQQHQAMLAIRAAGQEGMRVGEVADRLLLKPHSATGLIDRLERLGLVERMPAAKDKRQVRIMLRPEGEALLKSLSAAHREELRRIRPLLVNLIESL